MIFEILYLGTFTYVPIKDFLEEEVYWNGLIFLMLWSRYKVLKVF
jgi:hypothetical protein